MVEKIKKVTNPLTIIAIFASLAEIAGTVALPLVIEPLQKYFIWYVMGFPVILVILFFLTLNFNPKVLYSPSDYENEDNFVKAVLKKVNIDRKYKELEDDVVDIKNIIKNDTENKSSSDIIDRLNALDKKINKNKIDSISSIAIDNNDQSNLQADIYSYLLTEGGKDISNIKQSLSKNENDIKKALSKLLKRKLVRIENIDSSEIYSPNVAGFNIF